MIYINDQNRLFYYTNEPIVGLEFDIYNFFEFYKIEYQSEQKFDYEINYFNLKGIENNPQTLYTLSLDFLSNPSTSKIEDVLKKLDKYFKKHSHQPVTIANPLRYNINDLPFEEVMEIIDDLDFQRLNTLVSFMNNNQWVLSIQK
jgi:hypothetical protein